MDIQGVGGNIPPSFVTFDDPHESAGTVLIGEYPSGVINWGDGKWRRIGTPLGKFGTFNAVLADPAAAHAEFHFYAPRIFLGVDIYNDLRCAGDDHLAIAGDGRGARDAPAKKN